MAKDLSTEAAMTCLSNMAHRRGMPALVWTDRGTNFVGAAAALQKVCADIGVEWRMNTPKDAAAGGAWERLVQVVKKILCEALKERSPQVETFQAALVEAEFLTNCRPLVEVPLGAEEEEPITPNHFLLGEAGFAPRRTDMGQIDIRGQWNLRREIVASFWKQWVTHYIPSLLCRGKWRAQEGSLAVGDVVVFADDGLGRGEWHKGRVEKVMLGPDNIARAALVKTAYGQLRRPVAKLAKLDVRPGAGGAVCQ